MEDRIVIERAAGKEMTSDEMTEMENRGYKLLSTETKLNPHPDLQGEMGSVVYVFKRA